MAARRRKQQVRQAKQELYRQLVLEAAERVFAEKGYERAKMEEIARDAGLSPGTVYTVFKGKADVFRAVHEAGDEELLRCGSELARGEGKSKREAQENAARRALVRLGLVPEE